MLQIRQPIFWLTLKVRQRITNHHPDFITLHTYLDAQPSPVEATAYQKATSLLSKTNVILSELGQYKGCSELIRKVRRLSGGVCLQIVLFQIRIITIPSCLGHFITFKGNRGCCLGSSETGSSETKGSLRILCRHHRSLDLSVGRA